MKSAILFLLMVIGYQSFGQQLPEGVTISSNACNYAPGLSSYYFNKSNDLIGMILPDACNFNGVEEDGVNKYFIADFYSDYKKDTFATNDQAMAWMILTMEEYYRPAIIDKWQELEVQIPKVSLKYPFDWNYKTDNYEGIFKSKIPGENKITLMRKVPGGQSEVCFIIRTPNTAKLSTVKVMEMTAQMNPAIDTKSSRKVEYEIGGKSFETSQNQFMALMDQYHFWYADEQEIIYINYNLLKDERIRYPEVMKAIIESISW
ncbi:MAG: hypothetical protein IPH20_19350 [Bacteroidales bacterium]|jgi:hypothetical protein|nr:hypothetical protein [Bacteroidales bacterium]